MIGPADCVRQGALPHALRGLRPCDPKPSYERKISERFVPSRWSGPDRIGNQQELLRCLRASGLHLYLTQPKLVWVTSLDDLTRRVALAGATLLGALVLEQRMLSAP
jgi:hypothetical protein